MSIIPYGCTKWTLTERIEKKLDGNYTRMLRVISNKSWKPHPPKQQLYGHLPPIFKPSELDEQDMFCWRSKDELVSNVLLWTPTHKRAGVGQLARSYLQQLCTDARCRLEDLPEAMNHKDEWREIFREIRVSGKIWRWHIANTQRFRTNWEK